MSEHGWAAECQDCPVTIGWAYGETIRVRQEFTVDDEQGAHLWKLLHSEENPGHLVTVNRFSRWSLENVQVDSVLWNFLFGRKAQQ